MTPPSAPKNAGRAWAPLLRSGTDERIDWSPAPEPVDVAGAAPTAKTDSPAASPQPMPGTHPPEANAQSTATATISPPSSLAPPTGPLGPLAPTDLAAVHPWCPVPMLDGESVLRFHRTPFWSYPPSIFGLFGGLTVLALFTMAGGAGGAFLGLLVTGLILGLVRRSSWKGSGAWFTSERVVIREGGRSLVVPYEEIVRSSLMFESDAVSFRTTAGADVVLKGVPHADQVVNLFYSRATAAQKRTTRTTPG